MRPLDLNNLRILDDDLDRPIFQIGESAENAPYDLRIVRNGSGILGFAGDRLFDEIYFLGQSMSSPCKEESIVDKFYRFIRIASFVL